MSNVTNLIIVLGPAEPDESIEKINSFSYHDGKRKLNLLDVTQQPNNFDGDKYFVGRVLIGAYNHFPFDDFMQHIKSISFSDKGLVQVLLKGENHERFEVIYPFGLYEE